MVLGITKVCCSVSSSQLWHGHRTWDGNGGSQQIRNLNFKPDLVWIKNINGGHNHMLYDAIRGAGNELMTNGTQSQNQGGSSDLTSFEEGGFNLGSNNAVNQSGRNYLAWCWKAKGTGSSVSAGALTTSAYNKDQTWSTYGSFTGSTWNPAIGTLFSPNNGLRFGWQYRHGLTSRLLLRHQSKSTA